MGMKPEGIKIRARAFREGDSLVEETLCVRAVMMVSSGARRVWRAVFHVIVA
jgi:hypothetical protein